MGLVGAGNIATVHLAAWLVLGVDVVVWSHEGAAALVERHGGGAHAASLHELLDRCDVVDVCTPTTNHVEVIRQAAAAGLHVVTEKPLARTSVQAAEAIAACRAAGVQLYPAHVVRYFPEYEALHRAVERGAVGAVAVQRFSRTGSRPAADWFHDDELSGGIVLDQSIHDLDIARWNAGEVARVFARQVRSGPDQPVRSTQVVLSHANGAISYVTGSWARPGTTFRTTFEVAGTDGLLRHDSSDHPPLVLDTGTMSGAGTGLLPASPFAESPYLTQLREFYAALCGGPAPRVTADDGMAAIQIAEAATESLRTGRAVELASQQKVSTGTRTTGEPG